MPLTSSYPIGNGTFYGVVGGYRFNAEIYAKNLIDLKNILDEHGVKFLLAFGTLLGAIRDKGFVQGDSDTDIIVHEEEEEKIVKVLSSQSFSNSGFQILRVYADLVTLGRDKAYLDIYLFRRMKEGQRLICLGRHFIEEYRLSDPQKIDFLGHEFLIPKDPESYLKDKYGDWKTKKAQHATT